MRNASGNPLGTAAFKVAPLGGGGFVTHIEIANDGTMVCQSDVFNSFVKGPTAKSWTSLFTAASLPAGQFGPSRPNNYPTYLDESPVGGYATTIAPSNSSVLYATFNGYWWRSANQGQSWTKLGGPYVTKSNTGAQRLWARKSCVDPQNANVAMLGPSEGKVIYTTDGSTVNVLTVAAGATEGGVATPHLVAVDPSSSVVGGIKQKWAYSIHGTGIYQSTTGPGGAYSLLAGSPTNVCSMMYDAAGNLWAVNYNESNANGNLYKKTAAGSFARVNTGINATWVAVAVDPSNTNKVCVMDANGYATYSTDGAATWLGTWFTAFSGVPYVSQFLTAIKWIGGGRALRFFPANLFFHPTNGRLYASTGVGIRWSTPPTVFADVTGEWMWNDDTLGIENLEVPHVLVPPGGQPIYTVHDFGFFKLDDENKWTNLNHIPNPASAQDSAWFCDYAPNAPNFLVGSCAFFQNSHGYSADYGATWAKFSGDHPSGTLILGGCIVPTSTQDLYWFPSNNGRAAESHDGGATWSYITGIAGLPTSGESGWGYSLWNPHFVFCSDKATGDLYAYNYGPTGATSIEGLYRRAFGTTTWVKQCGRIGSLISAAVGLLQCVPGNSGHLFFKGDNNTPLYRSSDYGVNWSAIANTTNVQCFGFGKAATGKSYPTIFMYGTLSGATGLFRSDDNCTSWVALGQFPLNHLGGIGSITGHPDVYGKVYICTDHGGGLIGDYDCKVTVGA